MKSKASISIFVSLLLFLSSLLCPLVSAASHKGVFCGPKVMSKIYEHYEVDCTLESLKGIAAKQYGLASLDDICREAAFHGLKTLGFKQGDMSFLRSALKEGLVIFNNRGHFALIERIEKDLVFIYNPGFSFENYFMHKRLFEKHWDGTGLLISNKQLKMEKLIKHEKHKNVYLLTKRELKTARGANPCSNITGGGGPGYNYSLSNGAPVNGAPSSSSNHPPGGTHDPVNLQNGNLHMRVTDLDIPARGLPLRLSRFYNAQTASEVDGWIPDRGAGTWVIEDGQYSGQGDRSYTKETWQDFTLDLDMRTVTPGASYPWEVAWVNFRYFDSNNRYYLLIKTDGILELARRKGLNDPDPPAILASVSSGANPLALNHIRVEVSSNTIKIYVNGNLKIDLADMDPLIGSRYIALESYFSHSHFDNVAIVGEGNDRSYNFNVDDNDFIFGWGWSHSYGLRIKEYTDHVTISRENNARQIFEETGPGTYQSIPFSTYDTLTKDGSGFTLRSKHGKIHRFDTSGTLTYVEDRNGNRTTLSYSEVGGKQRLTNISSDGTRALTLHYGANTFVDYVEDPAGEKVKYYYDSWGHLIKVDDREERDTEYFYDPLTHNMEEYKDQEYNAYVFVYAYNDRILSQKDPFNNYTHFDYNWDTTHVVNQDGDMYKYNFDSNVFLQGVEDPEGRLEYTANDSNGNVLEHRDRNNRPTFYTYDSMGNVLDVENAKGHHVTFTYEGTYNFPLTMEDERGNITEYQYDGNGNLIKIISPSPLSYELIMSYNEYGQLETITDRNGNTTSFEYFPEGDLMNKISPGNRVTQYQYSDNGRLTLVIDSQGNQTSFAYDKNDRLLMKRNPLGHEILYEYSPNGELAGITDAMTNHTGYEHDPFGNLLHFTDANNETQSNQYDVFDALHLGVSNKTRVEDQKGNPTIFGYDKLNNLTSQTDAQSRTYSFEYDWVGNFMKRTDAESQVTDYNYDELNNLQVIDYQTGNDVQLIRDEAGNLHWIDDIRGRTYQHFDEINRLYKIQYPGCSDLLLTYDANSNLTKIEYPSGKIVEYEYNKNNEMTNIKADGELLVSFTYDSLGQRATKTIYAKLPVQSDYKYDRAGRLRERCHFYLNPIYPAYKTMTAMPYLSGLLKSFAKQTGLLVPRICLGRFLYTYDGAGNRISERTFTSSFVYDYDDLYQLTGVRGSAIHSYVYDKNGNRTSADGVSYTPNNLNQYAQVGGTSYAYDNNGNLTDNGLFSFGYNYDNRMTSANKAGMSASYVYDGISRRIDKTVNGLTTKFIYFGNRVIEERNSLDAVNAVYIYGPGLDEVLMMERGGENLFYLYDGLGSVRSIVRKSNGQVVESYEYDPFGKVIIRDKNYQVLGTSAVGNPYLFTGRRYDDETGLCYYRARMYCPIIGRFLSRDPLGFADDVNLYRYVGNNPITWVDPLGLCRDNDRPWWQDLLYESAVPGPFGQPVSEWGPDGPTGWGDSIGYTEKAGGAWMWTERGVVGVAAAATAIAIGGIAWEGLGPGWQQQGKNVPKILRPFIRWLRRRIRFDRPHHDKRHWHFDGDWL